MVMDTIRIGTHNGAFHCDEVMACALLKMLPEYKDAEIVRTRDQGLLDKCDIVVDVGMVFDHDKKRYDHHQAGFKQTMKELSHEEIKFDTPVSSAGLIFWFYGKDIIRLLIEDQKKNTKQNYSVDDEMVKFIMEMLYFSFIREIDDHDCNGNGRENSYFHSLTSLPVRVSKLSPVWDAKDQDTDTGFYLALDLVTKEFIQNLNHACASWRARSELLRLFHDHPDSFDAKRKALIFHERWIDWKPHMKIISQKTGGSQVDYVVFYDSLTDEWKASCRHPKDQRTLFTKEWRGFKDEELQDKCGIDGARFVHQSGHFASADTKDAIIGMIDKTTEYHEKQKALEDDNKTKEKRKALEGTRQFFENLSVSHHR